MRRDFQGSATRIRAASRRRVVRALRVSPERLPPRERQAFDGFAPILGLIADLPRWTQEEREGVVEILRAKAAGAESVYLRRMQRHTRLRRALLRIGSGRPPLRTESRG
jgi:hypothetical protein